MSLETQVRRLTHRLLNSTVRGVIKLLQDSGGLQIVQATLLGEDDVSDPIERLQEYGFTSSPPLDSECLVLMVGGTRSHPVCVKAENRLARKAAIANVMAATGLTLQPEDVLIYTSHQNFILLRAGSGNVIMHSPETIRLQAKQIQLAATEKLYMDVSGRGYEYLPLLTNTWELGSVPGLVNNITPPEHGLPAQ
jgi:phage gp45-like